MKKKKRNLKVEEIKLLKDIKKLSNILSYLYTYICRSVRAWGAIDQMLSRVKYLVRLFTPANQSTSQILLIGGMR